MRPARAVVDLDALRHNYALARRLHGGRALAVVKSNAYGHGALRCAQALAPQADGFAVAFLDEALALRAGGIRVPILVLEGAFDAQELADAAAHDVWLVVHQAEQIRMIEQTRLPRLLRAWLKVDSGMHRVGFAPAEVRNAYARLVATGKVDEIALMTHFARADEPGCGATLDQLAAFDAATADLPGPRSVCNSAAILGWPRAYKDWARPGILLYGADPMPVADHGLRPVMRLESAVFATRMLEPGQSLGYGARFTAARPTRVGLVALGYADGYPRIVTNGTPVAVDGAPSGTLGRVAMDMMTVDLTDLPQAGPGSTVELWGARVPVNAVAQAAGTIAYELLCNVKRVPLVYAGAQACALPAAA